PCSLLFTSIQYLPSTVEILTCCNSTSLSIFKPIITGLAVGRSEVPLITISPKRPNRNEEEDDLMIGVQQISLCSDRSEPSIGFVEGRGGVTCTHHILDDYSIPNETLLTPAWYSLCFKKKNGCEQCSVHLLCRLEEMEACMKLSVNGRFKTITSTNLTYPLKIGSSFPFSPSQIGVRLSVSHIWDRRAIEEQDIDLSSSDLSPSFSSLIPRHAYRMNKCLLHLKTNTTFGCVSESFQTKSSSALHLFTFIFLLTFLHH
ncbi:hypothetical protein PFISCL1PPCAC_6330, partial [Pristionchus fissidentatus]